MNKNNRMIIRLLATNTLFNQMYRHLIFSRTDEELTKLWQYHGKLMGYPQCCIDSFCTLPLDQRTPNQLKILATKLGFIPCPAHADSVINGDITLNSLIVNRDASLKPFPEE